MADLGRGTRYEFSADSKQFALLVGVAAVFIVIVFFSGVLVGNLIVSKQTKPTVISEGESAEAVEKRMAGLDEDAILRELDGASSSSIGGADSSLPDGASDPGVSSVPAEPEAMGSRRDRGDPQIIELKPPESRPSQRVDRQKKESRPAQKLKSAVAARPSTVRPSTGRPSTPSHSVGSSYYTVQVAAFRERPLADRFAGKLKTRDYEAYVVQAKLSSGLWYRVRVGKVPSEAQALALHERLMSAERLSGMVVHESR